MTSGPPPLRGRFRTDPRARAAYAESAAIYRIVPEAVSLPADLADLQSLVKWARGSGHRLVPRGAGSGLGGGSVGTGVIVDLTGMAPTVLEVDPATRTARTSAWVTCSELNRAAAQHGLRMPAEPSSAGWATLGGMVATNAAGARSIRYGSVRRWVNGLEFVTADGEVGWRGRGALKDFLAAGSPPPAPEGRSVAEGQRGRFASADVEALRRFEATAAPVIRATEEVIRQRFPKTRKNSSGYALDAYLESGDVLDLIIGSEGTLTLITEIEWKLDPIPPARAALRVALASLDDLASAVPALTKLDPSAIELLDRTFLDLIPGFALPAGTQAILIVEFERAEPARARAAVGDAVRAVRPWTVDVETALTPDEEERLWALRHAASPILAGLADGRRSMQVIEDACLPISRLGDYIRFVREEAADRRLDVVIFGHAGDGNVHVNLLPEVTSKGWEARVESLLNEVTEFVIHHGGTPSGEHGDGRLRAGFLLGLYGPEITGLFQLVKTAFDPDAIFNPGIIAVGSAEPPISRLKASSNAQALPPDIALALREIERGGGYGRPRLEIADGG